MIFTLLTSNLNRRTFGRLLLIVETIQINKSDTKTTRLNENTIKSWKDLFLVKNIWENIETRTQNVRRKM